MLLKKGIFMNDFFKNLSNKLLKRKEDGFYTLGDENLDSLWGLTQQSPNFTLDKECVENFAGYVFLIGLFGYNVANFTSIPAGFMATFQKGKESTTVVITNSVADYYKQVLVDLIDKKLNSKTTSYQEVILFRFIKDLLEEKEFSILDIALLANEKINKSKEFSCLQKNIENAMYPFSGDKDSLNSKNCNDNHILLRRICEERVCDNLQIKSDEEVDQLYNYVLQEWILPGYFVYRGFNRKGEPVEQKATVLNDTERFSLLEQKLKDREKISIAINMCATDYTADVVYAILEKIKDCPSYIQARERVDKVVPDTKGNYLEKKETMKKFNQIPFWKE